MRSRSASVACTAPCASNARMPKWMAVGEYQTSTSVESAAGMPSVGENWEKPVRTAASPQTASSSLPSTEISASRRGIRTSSCPARPLYTAGAAWNQTGLKQQQEREKHRGLLAVRPGRTGVSSNHNDWPWSLPR